MQLPLQITWRNLEASDAVESAVREKAQKLERFAEHITSCRVIIEAPHKHHHQGNIYHVKIDITLPGAEILATHHSDKHHAHEDVYVAIRDAFDVARRQLEDYVRKRRGETKAHEPLPHGKVIQLFPSEDYGIIESSDKREIYFHRNSVLDADFEKLEVGALVHFIEEMGENGPQASTVHVEGKHHVT
jgi:ribosomal subunit interface protein